ncbi:MAG: hypothetical protein AAF533_04700 [Acidobacteriota bacterium]
MGHHEFYRLPRTRRWQEVIDLIGAGAAGATVAAATSDAVRIDLEGGADDAGLTRALYLLARLPDAARSRDFVAALASLGVQVGGVPSVAELVLGLNEAVGRHLQESGGRTDLGDLAQTALAETVAVVASDRAASLFGTEPEDVRRELAKLGTKKQFGLVAGEFFGRLTERLYDYYLSRELPEHVGRHRRFETLQAKQDFQDALRGHCREASLIVESFAGSWYSKARYQKDLSEERVARFTAYVLTKIRRELSSRVVA